MSNQGRIELLNYTDQVVEAICKRLIDAGLVDKTKLKAMQPADAPYQESIERWGVMVKIGKKPVDNEQHGFAIFQFVTPFDAYVEWFEIDINLVVKRDRKYLEKQFAKLRQNLDAFRADEQRAVVYDVVDRPVVTPPNGHDILAKSVREAIPEPTHAAPNRWH